TATIAVLVFADWMKWLPPTGYVPLTENFPDGLAHLVLPVCVISIILIAHVSRMVRSELVDVLHTDYIFSRLLIGARATVVMAVLATIGGTSAEK
ncbi:hypothetical protein ACC677_36900, partial [Rhizobium ruizarguesonis]